MLKTVGLSLVPVVVGITCALLLDAQLGNVTKEQFELLLKNEILRIMLLFGSAYAANGNRFVLAAVSSYIYYYLITRIKSWDEKLSPFAEYVRSLFTDSALKKQKDEPGMADGAPSSSS